MIKEFPLTKENRILLARAFKNVPRVDMSIQCAIEGQMGQAVVDDVQNPTLFKIQVGPFFYYAGNARSELAQMFLENIEPYTLFMPSASGWIEVAKDMYQERLISFDRYSFSGEQLSSERLNQLIGQSAYRDNIKQMDLKFTQQLWGQDHFVNLADFDSPEDFLKRGVGFYAEVRNEIIGAAYSSLVCSEGIEVSLFVMENYRRRGIATALSAYLLKWSLENNAKANWDAANLESCKLAEKLGYTPIGSYPAYYLEG